MSLEESIQDLNSSIKELVGLLKGNDISNINASIEDGKKELKGTFTMSEAADYINVGYSTLSIRKDEWGIPYFQNGTRKLFTKKALDEFLHAREEETLNEDEYTKYLRKELKRVK